MNEADLLACSTISPFQQPTGNAVFFESAVAGRMIEERVVTEALLPRCSGHLAEVEHDPVFSD